MNIRTRKVATFIALGLVMGLGEFLGLGAEPLKTGAALPEIEVMNEEGEKFALHESLASGWGLVYFYPKADTPGCTAQACSLRDSFETLTDKGVTVYGVSCDKPADQKAFKDKYNLPFTLIADINAKLCEAFGVPVRANAFAARQAFLFKDGKLVWVDTKASTKKQADDVLTFIDQS
ncbi:MAG: peroxiredoxin [Verrucomicrobiota bacterium]